MLLTLTDSAVCSLFGHFSTCYFFLHEKRIPWSLSTVTLGCRTLLKDTREKKKSHGRKTLWPKLEKCSEPLAQILGGLRGGCLDDGLDPPRGLPPGVLPWLRTKDTMTPSYCAASRQNFTMKTHRLAWEGNSNRCGNPNAFFVSWAISGWREPKRKI